MEKKTNSGEWCGVEVGGGGLRIWSFQVYWRNSKWIFQVLIKNNVEYSGCDETKNMRNFQESWF